MPGIPDYTYRILIISISGSRNTNAWLNLIHHQEQNDDDIIDKIFLYTKNPYESKYELLSNKCERVGWKYFNDSKAFMEYSNVMNNIYDNIDKYTPNKKRGILLLCEDMISDMLSNKKFQPIVTELFMKTKR